MKNLYRKNTFLFVTTLVSTLFSVTSQAMTLTAATVDASSDSAFTDSLITTGAGVVVTGAGALSLPVFGVPGGILWYMGSRNSPTLARNGLATSNESIGDFVKTAQDEGRSIILKTAKGTYVCDPVKSGYTMASKRIAKTLDRSVSKLNPFMPESEGPWIFLGENLEKDAKLLRLGKGLVLTPIIITAVGAASVAAGAEPSDAIPQSALTQLKSSSLVPPNIGTAPSAKPGISSGNGH